MEEFDAMIKQGIQPNDRTFTPILSMYSTLNDLEKVEHWFHKMEQSYQIVPNIFHKNILLNAACKCAPIESAKKYFDSITAKDITTYNTMINGYVNSTRKDERANYMKHARELFDEMTMRGIQPDVKTFSNMIAGYSNFQDSEEADRLYQLMLQRNIEPTVQTYGALLRAHCRSKQIEKAELVFAKMDKDFKAYAIMIDAYFRFQMISKAENTLKEMVKANFKPNIAVINTVITGYLVANLIDKAKAMIDTMESTYNVKPDVVTWTNVLEYICKQNIDQGVKTLLEMEQKDATSYNTVIHHLCKQRNYSRVNEMIKMMIQDGINPDAKTFNELIQARIEDGHHVPALTLYHDMQDVYDVTPNLTTNNLILRLLNSLGHDTDAKELFKQMTVKDRRSYWGMISYCINQNKFDEAVQYIGMRLQEGIPEKAPFDIVIAKYLEQGQEAKAIQLYYEMQTKYGQRPELSTDNIILSHLVNRNRKEEALKFYDDMTTRDDTTREIIAKI
jgi:pentatricopeptide repeat protein